MHAIKKGLMVLTGLLLLLSFNIVRADTASAVGKWQTRDDKTGEPNSVIQIWEDHGRYFGKIAKIYNMKSRKPLERCVKCKGELYNQPILGLTIISDMRFEDGKYVDGTILDPRSGKTYHCILETINGGQQLKVRGYMGVPLFGQTKIWYRL